MSDDFRAAIRDRDPVAGVWVSLTDPSIAELLAEQGFDFVVVDAEHSPTSLETVESMARAVDAAEGDTRTVVRIPGVDPVYVKRVLDVGIDGIIVPMVDTAAEARDVVRAAKYPPRGTRGISPLRASRYYEAFEEYVASANDDLVTMVQIESETAVENAAAIAGVDGVDALFVGPADLSASLGVFGQQDSDAFVAAIDRVVEAAHGAGKPVGTLATSREGIPTWLDRGMDFLSAGTDVVYLAAGADRYLSEYRTSTGGR